MSHTSTRRIALHGWLPISAAVALTPLLTQCGKSYDPANDSYADEEEIGLMGDHATRKQLVDQLDGAYLRLKGVYDEMYRVYHDNKSQIRSKNGKKNNISPDNKEALGTIESAIQQLRGQNDGLDSRMRDIEDIAAQVYFIKHLHEYGIDVQDARIEAQINALLNR